MSNGIDFTNQTYIQDSTFPKDKVREYWDRDFYITDAHYVQVSTGPLRNPSTLSPNQFSPFNRITAGIESIAVVSDSAPVLSCS